MGRIVHLPILFLCIFSLSCGDAETLETEVQTDFSELGDDAAGEVLAVVNGQEIGSVNFQTRARRERGTESGLLNAEDKARVLNEMVDESLLWQEALARDFGSHPQVVETMVRLLLQEETSVVASDISEEQAQAYFEANMDEFGDPARINLRMISVRDDDDGEESSPQERIEAIRVSLVEARAAAADGADPAFGTFFRSTAIQDSEDAFRARGGDVGWVALGTRPAVPDVVMERAFELPVDGLSEPIESEWGWHVVWVRQRNEARELTYQQYRSQVIQRLVEEMAQENLENYMQGLRDAAEISIHEDILAQQEVRGLAPTGRESQ